MSRLHRCLTALVAAWGVVGPSFSSHSVHAQAISINLGNRGQHFSSAGLLPEEVGGVYPAANWNDYTKPAFAQEVPTIPAGTLKDSTGALVPNFAFSMTGSLVVLDTYNYAPVEDPVATANLKLMGSFLKGPFEPTIGFDVSLTAIPYAEYDLIIYVDGFSTGFMQWDVMETGQTFYSVDASPVNFLVANQAFSEYTGTDFVAANAELANPTGTHNYMRIRGLTSPDLTLVAIRPGGGEEAINGLQIVNAARMDGDYDGNGLVDGGDFLLWQQTLGSTTELDADGDGNLIVDAGDLVEWKNNFGKPFVATPVAQAVPEPAAVVVMLTGLLASCRRRTR